MREVQGVVVEGAGGNHARSRRATHPRTAVGQTRVRFVVTDAGDAVVAADVIPGGYDPTRLNDVKSVVHCSREEELGGETASADGSVRRTPL